MGRRQVPLEGKTVEGEDIAFRIEQDGNLILRLDDGAKLRLKPVVLSVLRTDKKTDDGERIYVLQALNHVVLVEPPEMDREAIPARVVPPEGN